jgi:hypothetical protein
MDAGRSLLVKSKRLSAEAASFGIRGFQGPRIQVTQMLTESPGLLGMREGALLFGREVTLQGSPGKGSTVTLRIPGREQAG